jgi:hypothetical protein
LEKEKIVVQTLSVALFPLWRSAPGKRETCDMPVRLAMARPVWLALIYSSLVLLVVLVVPSRAQVNFPGARPGRPSGDNRRPSFPPSTPANNRPVEFGGGQGNGGPSRGAASTVACTSSSGQAGKSINNLWMKRKLQLTRLWVLWTGRRWKRFFGEIDHGVNVLSDSVSLFQKQFLVAYFVFTHN